MKFVAYHQLGTTDNIIVDGRANPHTRLTLSHWPGSTTPAALKHDLSAGIVFNYLQNSDYQIDVEAISNNHFDEDGLVGLWSMLNPDAALERKELLIDVAGAGDFGTFSNRDAARIRFILNAWTQPELSPLNQGVFALPYPEQTMVLYEELLPRLANIVDRFEYLEGYWKAQDDLLEKSEQQIANGEITIVEHPDIDLAVVTLPTPKPGQGEETLALPWDSLVSDMAIHNATKMLRILLMQGRRYKLYYRYETWVQLVSRQTSARVDTGLLARQLMTEEEPGTTWHADDINDLTPALWFAGATQSKIEPASMIEQVVSYLVAAKH